MSALPAGMVTIGGALAGFLTELEERRNQHATGDGVPYGTFDDRMGMHVKAPATGQSPGA